MTDTLIVEIVNNKGFNFVTCGNAICRFQAIKYLNRSETLLFKNFAVNE